MIDFPSAPTVGQTLYVPSNGITYRWDGTLWLAGPNVGPGYGVTGDFCATLGWPATNVGATFTTVTPPVISGNAGGWYNATTGRYTPPPGRYHLHADVSGNSSTASLGNLGVRITKNGVSVQDNYGMTGYGYYTAPGVDVILDANGTDWFEAQFNCIPTSTVMESITFLAYPIAGAKGPPGDKGATGVSGGALLADVQVTVAQPTINLFNIPAKSAIIMFRFQPTVAATFYMRNTNASAPVTTNAYYMQQLYQVGTTAAANGSGVGAAATSIGMTSCDVGYACTGTIMIPDIAAQRGITTSMLTVSGGVDYLFTQSYIMIAGNNGYQFSTSTGNFAPGSFARVIGWP